MAEGVKDQGRRSFLTGLTAAVGGAAALLGAIKLPAAAAMELPALSEGVIFPDPKLCVGCGACEVSCGQVHKAAGLSGIPRIHVMVADGSVVGLSIASGPSMGRSGYRPSPCKQCPDPECYAVCPADALKLSGKAGARYIDESVCTACGKCEEACPYPIDGLAALTGEEHYSTRVFYDAEKNVYTKCDMCYWRPEGPACVGACPVNHNIQAGLIKSYNLCLDIKRSDEQTYKQIT